MILTGVEVLVEITVPMPSVKGNGITGENFPHQIPKGSITCADKQDGGWTSGPMHNICSQSKKILFKPTKKVIPVAVIKKNILAIQTPGDDMINRTGDVESSVSRHAAMITTRQINVN